MDTTINTAIDLYGSINIAANDIDVAALMIAST